MKLYMAAACTTWGGEIVRTFLAGTASGPFLFEDEQVKLYLAGSNAGQFGQVHGKSTESEQHMNLYLATPHTQWKQQPHSDYKGRKLSILESFFYVDDWMIPYIQNYWNFLLDSGAFTFMNQSNKPSFDWNSYVDKYADYINRVGIDLFFELDIDSVVGLKEVERLRERLHKRTGKRSIPVWHKSRGKDYFLQMCKDYDYVALGGIVTREFSKKEHEFFPWFIDQAHNEGTKIHGLGYTSTIGLPKYHFDSVDSTAWVFGNISSGIYYFDGKNITKSTKKGYRMKDTKQVALHNFREWVKFQIYAEKNL